MNEPILQTRGLTRSFQQGEAVIDVLRGIDLDIQPGEIVALLGPSGSGKSTLLQAVGLLEGGFEGSIRIAGKEAAKLPAGGRTQVRRDSLGFVYQFHHLLPDFSAIENVVLPQMIHGATRADADTRAEQLLAALGLSQRLTHRPNQLSGGEQQRVAVARALVANPKLILADEPTGNLDTHHGEEVMRMLQTLNGEGSTIVMVTHSPAHADYAGRIVSMLDGRILQERRRAA